jgi:hypothetical protein
MKLSDEHKAEVIYLIDIVAIHGITSNPFDSWTYSIGKSVKFWLRDFLHKDFPDASVSTYDRMLM